MANIAPFTLKGISIFLFEIYENIMFSLFSDKITLEECTFGANTPKILVCYLLKKIVWQSGEDITLARLWPILTFHLRNDFYK